MDLRFKHPFTMMVSGCTSSGKSVWTFNLVKNMYELVSPIPDHVIWCYSEYQPLYEQIEKIPYVTMHEGLPDLETLTQTKNKPKLLVLDDLCGTDSKKNAEITTVFVRKSHHANCSAICLVNNLFLSNMRTSRLNCHYMVLMRSLQDRSQIMTLGRQIFPENPRFLQNAFKKATLNPYSYLMIDLEQNTLEDYCLRSKIFPGEITEVYVPESKPISYIPI